MWLQVIQIVNFTIQLISSLVPISIEHARFATIYDSESFWSLLLASDDNYLLELRVLAVHVLSNW